MKHLIRAAGMSVVLAASGLSQAQTVTDASLVVENVKISGTLSRPISLIFLSINDLLIAEQHTGQVRRMTNGVVAGGSVLDLPVASAGEQGLLSFVKDPQFTTNNYIYLYYTRATADGGADIDHKIVRYTWNGTSLVSPFELITLPSTPGNNHNGGVLVFGPPNVAAANQKLFCIIGDLNRNGQLENYSTGAAPDDTACVLRINTDGTTPGDNPFFTVPGANGSLQRTYAYGIRNSFGLDFDPVSNALWDTENGPGPGNVYDEINRIDPGFNSGWEHRMGPVSRGFTISGGAPSLHTFGGLGTYADPKFSWVSAVAPAGIHFLRGSGLGASYLNDCFVGDNNFSRIYKFELNSTRDEFVLTGDLADKVFDTGDNIAPILFGSNFGVPVDLDTGPDGNLYVVSLVGGTIYRIRLITNVTDWTMY